MEKFQNKDTGKADNRVKDLEDELERVREKERQYEREKALEEELEQLQQKQRQIEDEKYYNGV